MKRVFADTSYFIALLTPQDSAHAMAVQASPQPPTITVTSDWIMAELGNYFASSQKRVEFCRLVDRLMDHPLTELLPADRSDFNKGLQLYRDRTDKEWSLVDCVSIVIAKRLRIDDVLSTDHHFRQAGFNALLIP